jgi:hypothetical protein
MYSTKQRAGMETVGANSKLTSACPWRACASCGLTGCLIRDEFRVAVGRAPLSQATAAVSLITGQGSREKHVWRIRLED